MSDRKTSRCRFVKLPDGPGRDRETSCQALLVEPDIGRRVLFSAALSAVAQVSAQADFVTARRSLSTTRYDLLVTNIRLEAYNGLHLVYLARNTETRSVVYAEAMIYFSPVLHRAPGRSTNAAGGCRLHCRAMLTSALPPSDRRDPAVVDRRRAVIFRGGRRSADLGVGLTP